MPYIAKQDLIDELGQSMLVKLTDDAGTGVINDTRVNKAIDFASGIFDSYARSRYSLPVPVTTLVKALNLDLAVFHLYKARTSIAEGVYKVKQDAYNEALKTLRDIAAGKAALDVPAVEETKEKPASSDEILTNAGRSKFTDDRLKAF